MLKEPFLPAERTPRAHGIYFAELRCAFGGWVVSLSSSEHKKVHSYLSSQFYFRAINIGLLRQSSSILSATEYVPISYSPADFLVAKCLFYFLEKCACFFECYFYICNNNEIQTMKAINELTQINKMGGVKNPTSSACCFAIHNHIIPYTNVSGRLVASIPDAAGRPFCVDLQTMGHRKLKHFNKQININN